MDKQTSSLGTEALSPSMTRASSSSTDSMSAATPDGDVSSPVQETPVSPGSPPSHKLKKKRSKKNSESEGKPTLTRAISLSTSSMVTPILNASSPQHSQSRKKASGAPRRSMPATKTSAPAVAGQKPKESTPPLEETSSPFDMGELAKAIPQVDTEVRAKSAPPTPQRSYAAVTATSITRESSLSKPIATTRGKAPKLEGLSQRSQPYGRQSAQPSHQQIPYRKFTPEERNLWETLLKRLNGDKAHLSWLENDAGNTETAKLAVLKRIIDYMDQYGTMPMEVTIKSSPNAKGGVEKVVCGPCRQEQQPHIKEYPTVQKAAVHITSNHWEMQLWLCIVPGCGKAFRCRDGIQNPKRHMEKMHPNWSRPSNPDPSIHVTNPGEQAYLTVPSTSGYAESLSGTEYSDLSASVGSYPESSNGGYPSTSYQAPYYTTDQAPQSSIQQSPGVFVRMSSATPAPLKLQPPLMPIIPADLPEPFPLGPSPSPSRSQGPLDDILSRLGIGASRAQQPNPTLKQGLVMVGNNLTLGSVSPSEMANVVPTQVAKRPSRRATVDLRPTQSTGVTITMEQTSLGVAPGRARNVSNPTMMYTAASFQIPVPPQQQPFIPQLGHMYQPVPTGQMYQPPVSAPQMYQPPYAPSSHSASLSPQQLSPGYTQSMGYGQTPESYMSSPPHKMPSTSPNSQPHLHLAYPSPAPTHGFSTSPPFVSHMPLLNSTAMVDTSPYLTLQASGQQSPNQSSRSSHSSSPYPPIDDPLLGFDLSQNGQRTSVDGGSGGGQSPEYVKGEGQPPLSAALLQPSLGDPLQLGGAPPSPNKAEPLSAVEMGQLLNYFDKVQN